MTKKRKFIGFSVVTREGRYLRQYDRPTETETRQAYERHNPQIEGHEDGYTLFKYTTYLELLE